MISVEYQRESNPFKRFFFRYCVGTLFVPCMFFICPSFWKLEYSRDCCTCKSSHLNDEEYESGFRNNGGYYECCFGCSALGHLFCCFSMLITCIFYPFIRYKIYNVIALEHSYCVCCNKVLFYNMAEYAYD